MTFLRAIHLSWLCKALQLEGLLIHGVYSTDSAAAGIELAQATDTALQEVNPQQRVDFE